MKLTFYGVRGSHPTPSRRDFNTLNFGGNTTCLHVETESEQYILDAGTGIAVLGQNLLQRFGRTTAAKILLTHVHWDHIQGFPFFAPAWIPGCKVDVYSGHTGVDTVMRGKTTVQHKEDASNPTKLVFEGQQDVSMGYFPVPVQQMGGAIAFHMLKAQTPIGLATFCYFDEKAHPGGMFAYRIDENGKSVVFMGDYESDNGQNDKKLVQFAKNADILVIDGQYTEAEYATKKGWGHSTARDACMLGHQACAKMTVITHHDPSHDDDMLNKMEADLTASMPADPERQFLFACEGMTLKI